MRYLSVIGLAATLSAWTSWASAQSVDESVSRSPANQAQSTESDRWYGWQILAADVAGIAAGSLLTTTLDFDEAERPPDLGLVAAAWYGVGALGAPAVHYAHGNGGEGAASLGMRLMIPPLSGFFGFVGTCLGRGDFEHDCVVDGYTTGSIVGLAGVAALDSAVLAWDRPTHEPRPDENWYGWQLIVMDGAALAGGAVLTARRPRSEAGEPVHPALGPWAADYVVGLVGGPVIHFTHGRWGTGFISLGARAIAGPMFVVAGVAGYCANTAGVHDCSKTGAAYGLLGGLVAVDLFDALVLANEEAERPDQASYAPYVGVGPGSLTVAGTFP